jgi:outer membrane protein OmpA-like peptidoglycan-associated protein
MSNPSRTGSVTVVVEIKLDQKKGSVQMSRSIATKSLAAAAVMGLFAAHAATAQQTQNLPQCTTHFIYFSTGSHALTPEDQDHIRDVAGMMQSTPTFVATIVGKTDSVGSADFTH